MVFVVVVVVVVGGDLLYLYLEVKFWLLNGF